MRGSSFEISLGCVNDILSCRFEALEEFVVKRIKIPLIPLILTCLCDKVAPEQQVIDGRTDRYNNLLYGMQIISIGTLPISVSSDGLG